MTHSVNINTTSRIIDLEDQDFQPRLHPAFDSSDLLPYTAQFPPLIANGPAFVPHPTKFPSQSSTLHREFTNRSRNLAPVTRTVEQNAEIAEENYQQQSPNENTKKRNSGEIPLRSKKRNRNLTCDNPACRNRTFADEPNLNRHQREVHGQAQYYCSVLTCERRLRGFKRRDNCINHQKRSHGNLTGLVATRDDNTTASPDSSLQLTEDGNEASSAESQEGEAEEKILTRGPQILEQKMKNLNVLLKKKKRVEEGIARAKAELQQALQLE